MHQKDTTLVAPTSTIGWRIYAMPVSQGLVPDDTESPPEANDWSSRCANLRELGFNAVWVPAEHFAVKPEDALAACLRACTDHGLRLMLDYQFPREGAESDLFDTLAGLPIEGSQNAVVLRGLARLASPDCRRLLQGLRERFPLLSITVWTPGMTPAQLAVFEGLPVDGVYSSLPWWDYRDSWLTEEYERLSAVGPVIAPVADPRAQQDAMVGDAVHVGRRLAAAAMVGEAFLVPGAVAEQLDPEVLAEAMACAVTTAPSGRGLRRLTGPLSLLTGLFRPEDGGRLLLLNPDPQVAASVTRSALERRLPNGFVLEAESDSDDESVGYGLEGGGWRFLTLAYAGTVAQYSTTSPQQRGSLSSAMRAPRVIIEAVRPTVNSGAFPIKRTLGEAVVIQADIYMDGHDQLAAELLWRPVDEPEWQRTPMTALGNDVWEARITPRQLGRYVYMIRAWMDKWRTYCGQLEKKSVAGVDVSLEVEEGRRMLAAQLERAGPQDEATAAIISAALQRLGPPADSGMVRKPRRKPATPRATPDDTPVASIPAAGADDVGVLLDPDLAAAVDAVAEPAFEAQTSMQYPLSMERNEASFSSWYELFPRSQSEVPGEHGTFRDVIRRLPDIRRMGFDVLYFPPIHPIGQRNRKGRNNSLQAEPGDPGSPYAIGSADGGHDAVHPELGTLNDFREMVEAAQRHGLEVALDFAIQCSPDHPWLREHPDWFNWRADGTLQHAENPPKRYEDIVNPDFYSPLASTPRQAALWRALRDIVIFWVQQGVRIFRVDNPHTKPLPFWEWMLREVRDRHPDTIFLSEAFTRPAMMYRLAKVGFSQSYTYFTWRNTKQELIEYMTELNREPVRDFFRPNFFVNTPDINPVFLQTSGRAGFLIRAVLAGTLSGSWGMYNGFELCVAEPVPGKEEYLDSEKYQLRQWDMETPGNIIDEITRLNRIRRSHPALQSHLGVRFHEVDNDQILFYTRHSAENDSIVLVAVSLDPHRRQSGRMVLPLWEWGLTDHDTVPMHDLFDDRRFMLRGRSHYIELTPERPFALWALAGSHGGHA